MSSYESIFDVQIVDNNVTYTTVSDDFIDTDVEFTRDNYKNPPLWLLKPDEKIIIDVQTENSENFDLQVRKLIDTTDDPRILFNIINGAIGCVIRNSNQEQIDSISIEFNDRDSPDFSGIENLFKQYFNKEIKITLTPYCIEINGINFKAIEFTRSNSDLQDEYYIENPFLHLGTFHYKEGDYEFLFVVGNTVSDGVVMFNNRICFNDASYAGGDGGFEEINKQKISDSHYQYIYKNTNNECEYLQMTLNSIDNDQGRLKITKTIVEEIKHVKLDFQSEIPYFTKIIHVTKGQSITINKDNFIVKDSSGVSPCSITCNSVPEGFSWNNNELTGVISESCSTQFSVTNGEDTKEYRMYFIVTN